MQKHPFHIVKCVSTFGSDRVLYWDMGEDLGCIVIDDECNKKKATKELDLSIQEKMVKKTILQYDRRSRKH